MPVIMKDNFQYAYTTKGTVFHTLSNAEYEALSEEEKMNGDVYCIPDREPVINPDQLWEKVGTGTLDIGDDLTDGVNQLNSSLANLPTNYPLMGIKNVGTVNLNTLTNTGWYIGTSDGTISLPSVDLFLCLVIKYNGIVKQFIIGLYGYGTVLYQRYSSNNGSTWNAATKITFTT